MNTKGKGTGVVGGRRGKKRYSPLGARKKPSTTVNIVLGSEGKVLLLQEGCLTKQSRPSE